ncbi:hypothetical protein [uncultured Demequina sp.]|uniref:hypothetical protein n=1 Tax=uncultured Demequina sp. TaxID=693499 RepID=UPI0025F47B87|nr:hypothetical protein [uncultured Demequina sp.]
MTETTPSAEYERGQQEERERFAEYLAHFEKRGRRLAAEAESEESRTYQTTVANSMGAMRRAIQGGFHWKDDWRATE